MIIRAGVTSISPKKYTVVIGCDRCKKEFDFDLTEVTQEFYEELQKKKVFCKKCKG